MTTQRQPTKQQKWNLATKQQFLLGHLIRIGDNGFDGHISYIVPEEIYKTQSEAGTMAIANIWRTSRAVISGAHYTTKIESCLYRRVDTVREHD